MAKLKVLTNDQFKNRMTVLIFGKPDSGKTMLAASLLQDPTMLPALVVVMDGSEVTLKDYANDQLHVIKGNAEVLKDVYEVCRAKNNPYRTVVIDNVTHLHRQQLQKSAEMSKAKQEADSRRTADTIRSEYVYQPADYGYARNVIMPIADTFLDPEYGLTNINFIATCWATSWTDATDPRNPIEKIDIDLAGKLMGEFAGLFDIIGYLESVAPSEAETKLALSKGEIPKTKRYLSTYKSTRLPLARNRGNKFPYKLENPTLPKIKEILMSDKVNQGS